MGHNNFKPREYALPTPEQAHEFAIMLGAGLPPEHAIPYFVEEMGPAELQVLAQRWAGSVAVQKAVGKLQGKPWQDMDLKEKCNFALDKTYTEMAYFLYSTNYATVVNNDKQKADTCRQAIEAKLAGTAGKLDPLSQFWDDVQQGRVKLPSIAPVNVLPA